MEKEGFIETLNDLNETTGRRHKTVRVVPQLKESFNKIAEPVE